MAEAKTRPTKVSLKEFLDSLPEQKRRADCETIAAMMQQATGEPPVLWGSSIVGFGTYLVSYANGTQAEWPLIGFSPRKQDITLYVMFGEDSHADLLARLGKHRTSKVCLYVKRLADLDLDVLQQLIADTVAAMEPVRVRPKANKKA